MACAAAVAGLSPAGRYVFVGIGVTLQASANGGYSYFIKEQIGRSGLEDTVAIIDLVPNLDPAYDAADIFFLSSRLDPMPNVAIDAAFHGLPVVCFDKSGGMAQSVCRVIRRASKGLCHRWMRMRQPS